MMCAHWPRDNNPEVSNTREYRLAGDIVVRVEGSKLKRLPVVLTRVEVRAILAELYGGPRLVCALLYRARLRLLEGLALRVKDLDFGRRARLIAKTLGGAVSKHD
jgi:integrase